MSAIMERTHIDMKAVELAAQSPDPRVRSVAQRRLEIEKEIVPLDGFLSFYSAEAANIVVPVTKKANPVSVPSHANGHATEAVQPKGKTERMIEVAKGVIVTYGQPMPLPMLFETMQRDHPALCLASPDSMRARLAEHRDKLVRVDSRGYWPVGTEVPANE